MNRDQYYILDEDKNPVAVSSMQEYFDWIGDPEARVVKRVEMGEVMVSTIFLGLDHAWDGEPLLFETMIFGGLLDQEQWRYSTWSQAVQGHDEAVRAAELNLSHNDNDQRK